MTTKDPHRYDDMLDLDRPVSLRHKPMPIEDRAAQFMPFRALTGYEDAVAETARFTENRVELTEDKKQELDRILRTLMTEDPRKRYAAVTYFLPDLRKEGGRYVTEEGLVAGADPGTGWLRFADGRKIPLAEISQIRILTGDEVTLR